MVPMEVLCVWLDPRPDGQYVLILKETDGSRALPMPIDPTQARAIQWALDEVQVERPMTHDLLVSGLLQLGATIEQVEVAGYDDGCYTANIVLKHNGRIVSVDARPSDGAAVALRCGAPVFASEEVLGVSGATLTEEAGGFTLATRGWSSEVRQEDAPEEDVRDLEVFRRIISEVNLDDDEGPPAAL